MNAVGLDQPGVDRRLLVGLACASQVGKEVRPETQGTAVEPGVEPVQDIQPRVQALGLHPGEQEGVPGPARLLPFGVQAVQPARIGAGFGQPAEAPAGGSLAESLPCPLHDHHGAAGQERGMHQVKHPGQISHVMQRGAGHDRVHPAGKVAVLELGPTVGGSRRRFGVDPCHLISGRLQPGDEATQRAAADLHHDCRRRGERAADGRPDRGQPAFFWRHGTEPTAGIWNRCRQDHGSLLSNTRLSHSFPALCDRPGAAPRCRARGPAARSRTGPAPDRHALTARSGPGRPQTADRYHLRQR